MTVPAPTVLAITPPVEAQIGAALVSTRILAALAVLVIVALTPTAPTRPVGLGETLAPEVAGSSPISAPTVTEMPPAEPEVVALMPSAEAQMVAPGSVTIWMPPLPVEVASMPSPAWAKIWFLESMLIRPSTPVETMPVLPLISTLLTMVTVPAPPVAAWMSPWPPSMVPVELM